MKNFNTCFLFVALILFANPASTQTADNSATLQTRHLLQNLHRTLADGIMFGHQDDLAYGVGWKYSPGRSDVNETAGDLPAVYGWELGRLEIDAAANLDGVPFDVMKEFILAAYERGGVATLSWHLNNPLTGKTAWDPAPGTVASILPGGSSNQLYKSWLDKVAGFMLSLKAKNGELVPVIFRPFHELNGSWFWWGKNHCTPEEFKALYRFTKSYLTDVKAVHNLLYAFNTDRFASEQEYLERYPGDDAVDILGFDIYQKGDILQNDKFITTLDSSLSLLERISKSCKKVPALTEFGFNELPDSAWWTGVFYKAIQKHAISYALAWRNAGRKSAGETEFYVPYKGQLSEADFKRFSKLPRIIFEARAKEQNLYAEPR